MEGEKVFKSDNVHYRKSIGKLASTLPTGVNLWQNI